MLAWYYMQQFPAKFTEIKNFSSYKEKNKYLIDNSSVGKYVTRVTTQ
jgi:hypothetical protein